MFKSSLTNIFYLVKEDNLFLADMSAKTRSSMNLIVIKTLFPYSMRVMVLFSHTVCVILLSCVIL